MAAKASSLLIGICAILQAYAVAQTTTTLPQPEVYADGKFFSPNTLRAQIYSPGSTMRISWETTFKSIHLYLVYDEDYNSAFPLIRGSSGTSYDWLVDDQGNNTRPFAIRAADALSTTAEKQLGGFLSGQFWIGSSPQSSSSTESSSSSTPPQSNTETTTSTGQSTSQPATTDDQSGTTSSETTSTGTELPTTESKAATSALPSPATTPSPTSTLKDETAPETDPADEPEYTKPMQTINVTAVGIGAGLGGFILAIIAIAAICMWQRRRRRRRKQLSISSEMGHGHVQMVQPLQYGHMGVSTSLSPKHELFALSPKVMMAEAPYFGSMPQELEGSNVTQRTR